MPLSSFYATGSDFIEECVVQQMEPMRLSPSGLNTLRIITQLNSNDEAEIVEQPCKFQSIVQLIIYMQVISLYRSKI